MNKYAPLESHLRNKGYEMIPMSFSEIEDVILGELPASARKHRAWWSNNPSNSVVTQAWLDAGYKTTDVRLDQEKLVFRRVHSITDHTPQGPSRSSSSTPTDTSAQKGRQHPAFGAMKGTITIQMGFDLTDPSGADWCDGTENG